MKVKCFVSLPLFKGNKIINTDDTWCYSCFSKLWFLLSYWKKIMLSLTVDRYVRLFISDDWKNKYSVFESEYLYTKLYDLRLRTICPATVIWLFADVYVQMCMWMYTDMIEIDFPESQIVV